MEIREGTILGNLFSRFGNIYPVIEDVLPCKQRGVIEGNEYRDYYYKIKIRLRKGLVFMDLIDYKGELEKKLKSSVEFEYITLKEVYVKVMKPIEVEEEIEEQAVDKSKARYFEFEGLKNVINDNEVVRYEYLESEKREKLEVCIGVDTTGQKAWYSILNSHTLVGGSARWGKSSFLNVFITSMMLSYSPQEIKFMGCDFKLSDIYYYRKFEHFREGKVSVNKMEFKQQIGALEAEIVKRASILEGSNCRNVVKFNAISEEKMPYIIFVIDELPQLTKDKEISAILHSFMAKSASYGIYFVLASQDNTKDTIGKCKMNCSQTIGFHVRDNTDSETLVGKGYNLQDIKVKGRCFYDNGSDGFKETQIYFLEEEEIEARLKDFKM